MPGSNAHVETDVLVVGAGPGGSAAAYHLARHGVDVTVVEKASFPREKVCGDGMTPRAIGSLERMVLPSARRFTDLGVQPRQRLVSPKPIDELPREVNTPEPPHVVGYADSPH